MISHNEVQRRLCIAHNEELKTKIMNETHDFSNSTNPSDDMYKYLKKNFKWPNMKHEAIDFGEVFYVQKSNDSTYEI